MILAYDTRAGGSREVIGSAIFNGSQYRLELRREWNAGEGTVNFVMLNPSIATEFKDDPTIRRCIGFARAWGFKGMVVTNLFSYRSTKPAALKKVEDPIGPGNDAHIVEVARSAQKVVLAWGVHGELKGRGDRVVDLLAKEGIPRYALGYTKTGQPQHPLYVPATRRPARMLNGDEKP